ncbi:MAG: hypothetical protein QOF06_529 [Solirubrobacterales bacterium]|nr:hypothetical protein [Solirubrobacterales bacterium]
MSKLRKLCLALTATVLVSAGLGAASASAAFEAEGYPTQLLGEGTSSQTFVLGSKTLNCTGTYSGTASSASETLSLVPNYWNCQFVGEESEAKITTNGCNYTYDSSGSVSIAGASCGGISIAFAFCTVTLPAQSGLQSATYTNQGSGTGRTIKIENWLSGVTYNASGTCGGVGGPGSHTNGSIVAPISVRGEKAGSPNGVFTTARHVPRFEAEKYPASISGPIANSSETLFATPAWSLSCTSSTLSGNLAAATKDLSLGQSTSGCHSSGSIELQGTVSMNTCNYVVHAANAGPPYSGTLEVDCSTPGDSIKIALTFCTVTIPEQSGLSGVSLTNSGSGSSRQVTAQLSVSNVTYTEKGFACTAGSTGGTFTNGVLGGKYALKATNSGSQVGLFVSGEKL